MKHLIIWMAISISTFGVMSACYHLYLEKNPRKVFVILDSSYPMGPVWHSVENLLQELNRRRYTKFRLVTEKSSYHDWAGQLDADAVKPYAPRNLSNIARLYDSDMDDADEVFLISNADKKIVPEGRWKQRWP